ncbi:MAG: hypothetical protein K8S55_05580 [Phycisphaerae bacterium]|nr:hypothetical protein [Phycisphaerae bacterium]
MSHKTLCGLIMVALLTAGCGCSKNSDPSVNSISGQETPQKAAEKFVRALEQNDIQALRELTEDNVYDERSKIGRELYIDILGVFYKFKKHVIEKRGMASWKDIAVKPSGGTVLFDTPISLEELKTLKFEQESERAYFYFNDTFFNPLHLCIGDDDDDNNWYVFCTGETTLERQAYKALAAGYRAGYKYFKEHENCTTEDIKKAIVRGQAKIWEQQESGSDDIVDKIIEEELKKYAIPSEGSVKTDSLKSAVLKSLSPQKTPSAKENQVDEKKKFGDEGKIEKMNKPGA